MKGIHFVTDFHGKAVAVQIDLKQWGELWEDMYDRIVADQRKDQTTVPWEDVKKRIKSSRRRH